MKNVFRLTMLSVLGLLSVMTFSTRAFASTTPQEMHISCTAPNPDHQTGLHRPKGDGNIWTFQIVLDGDARFVKGPYWSYPGKDGTDPDWGLWTGGADADSSLGWSSPGKTGDFQIRVNGQIVCGDGPGGQPIDFSAGWDGSVDFNAEIKVRRKDSGDDYSSSATVAAGGLGSSEHQANVQVTAKDSDGNPMSGISVPAPTIQNGDGVSTNASISPSSATSDSNGKADFTFISSDIVGNVTLEEDGGESSASASIGQGWNSLSEDDQWDYDEYFDYDTPSNLTFNMSLNSTPVDQPGSVPIKGHDIRIVTTDVSGWQWDPNAGEDWDGDGYPDGDYEYQNPQNYSIVASEYGDLVPDAIASEGSPGRYTAQQTVRSNEDFLVDNVYFEAFDYSADDGQ